MGDQSKCRQCPGFHNALDCAKIPDECCLAKGGKIAKKVIRKEEANEIESGV